jgi:branched-chain amino acid transport system substrate-binding protein
MKTTHSLAIALLLATAGLAAQAQILIGQTSGFTGTVAAGVKETLAGAMLYFDRVNAKGGVGGQRIELLSMDDKFEPALAAENARELIEKKNVVALFLSRGTPHTEAVIPWLEKYHVPLVGPSTGAMVLHQPVQKYVFNVRATYQHEAEKAISHQASIGMSKIAVLYTDDSFGADGLAGAQKGLQKAHLEAVGLYKFDRTKPDFAGLAPAIVQAGAQSVLLVASGTNAVAAIQALRTAGSSAQFVTLSNNATAGFISSLGGNARGVIVSQVFPQSQSYALVKELADAARAKGLVDTSPAMLEGFTAAKVLVEALRRAGPRPTRERLHAALEGMDKFDVGGLEIGYSPTDHTGLDFADLSIIGSDGKFRR